MTQRLINNGDSGLNIRAALNANFSELYGLVTPLQFNGSLQAAIDSGAPGVILPPGDTVVSSILMPHRTNFSIMGFGRSSRLIVQGGASTPAIRWDTTANVYDAQSIGGFTIVGTNGSQHLIDTTGAGGLKIDDLYVTDVPAGKSAIYVNGAASVYTHDVEIAGLDVYSNTAGHSAVRFGPYASDSRLSRYQVNGNFQLQYPIYGDIGAVTCTVSDGHPYNAAQNVLKLCGGNNDWNFDDNTFDNSTLDICRITDSSSARFTDCYFEAIKSGYSGLYADGSGEGLILLNSQFSGSVGAASCVRTGSSMNGVQVRGGSIDQKSNFTKLWDFNGLRSTATGVNGDSPLGFNWTLSEVSSAPQASATEYLGVRNGANAANAAYLLPYDSFCPSVYIASTAITSGQTMTFQVYRSVGGSATPIGSPLVLNTSTLAGTITLNQSFSQYDQFYISSVYSGTLPGPSPRWLATFAA